MNKKLTILLTTAIFLLICGGVFLNIKQQLAVDESKLPEKLEANNLFQRWITNLKNNDVDVGADDFRLFEEAEIYNTMWVTIKSIDDPGVEEWFNNELLIHQDLDKVVFSPSDKEFIDFRHVLRGEYNINEVRFLGQKEDKILDSKVVDCSIRANCYFDRAYFLDNDVFVITEISRNIHKRDDTAELCPVDEICTYTIKLHLIDLIQNKRLVYESGTFEVILEKLIPEL
ncbi:MAG: hypothetical protein ABH884_03750 [Candidatus Komeilibacteria bacterium]